MDILEKPQKYRVRFAIWDKIKEIKQTKKSEQQKQEKDDAYCA